MMKKFKFILSGGGTGGHIYPAIAIADELKTRFPDAEFLFVGAQSRMEMQKVPAAGYPIKGLWISGLQRKLTLKNLMFPLKVISSLVKARLIVKNFSPDAVIGTGGFASGPLLKVASMAGIPTVIQEQNSYPGITNKILGKTVDKICVAYENLERFFPKDKIVFTGNPVREDIMELQHKKQEAIASLNLDPAKKTLLILGGSLGARKINDLTEKQLVLFRSLNLQVIWQCGKLYYDEYARHNSEDVKVLSFIEKIDLVYAAADIVISRAGASSVSELCLVGKPVIFIPSPNVAEDHQTKNAKAVADRNAAMLIRESELDSKFEGLFSDLVQNVQKQAELSANIKQMGKAGAARDIADVVVALINKQSAVAV